MRLVLPCPFAEPAHDVVDLPREVVSGPETRVGFPADA